MKCYIYCPKAKPYLWKYWFSGDNGSGYNYEISSSLEEWEDEGTIMNGKIVASFDLNKVEKMFIQYGKGWITTDGLNIDEIENKSALSRWGVSRYDLYIYKNNNKYLYAWHIDNLKILDKPLELKDSILDNSSYFYTKKIIGNMVIHQALTKAPQNWCYAYDNKDNKCIIISIKSKWVCEIFNGKKTIELRKTAPKELIKNE